MVNSQDLSKILPHKPPMILIDGITDYSLEEKYLKSFVTIRESSIFYDRGLEGIDSITGIEYMAQSIGCFAYYRNGCRIPKAGYLLGTRHYNNSISKFERGKTYYILVKEIFAAEIYSFDCFIYNDNNEEIASAAVNVYQEQQAVRAKFL